MQNLKYYLMCRFKNYYFFNIKLFTVLILLFFIPLFTFSQLNLFGISYSRGFIAPHNHDMRYFIKGRINSFSLVLGHQTTGKKNWQHQWYYPEIGFGLYYADLGNPEVLGNVKSAFLYFQKHMIKNKKSGLYVYFDFGVAYLNKHFDAKYNNVNYVVSTDINVYSSLFFKYQYSTKKIVFFTGVGLIHYSNGGTKLPNLGLNVLSSTFGFRYQFKENKKIEPIDIGKFKKYNDLMINQSYCVRGNELSFSEKLAPVSSLSVDYGRYITPKRRLGVGFDVIYDEVAINYFRLSNTEYKKSDLLSFGVHFSYNLVFNNIHFTFQQIFIVFQKHNMPQIYQRFGLRAAIGKHFLTGLTLVTEYFEAQFIEPSIGFRF